MLASSRLDTRVLVYVLAVKLYIKTASTLVRKYLRLSLSGRSVMNKVDITWKSDLPDNIKRRNLRDAVVTLAIQILISYVWILLIRLRHIVSDLAG